MSSNSLRVLLLAVALAPRGTYAADVAVLDLRLSEATPAVEKQVLQWLQASLRGVGYSVLERAEVHKRLADGSIAPGCSIGPCLVRVGRLLQVRHVLVGGIAVHGSSYDILLSLLDTESGCSLAQVNARCDVCNFADVGESVARAARKLHAEAKRFEASQGRVIVRGHEGAAVLLDGVPMGTAPISRMVAAGRHRIELRGAGTALQEEIVVVPGRRVMVGQRRPHPRAPAQLAEPTPPASPGWPGWLALAGGGALVLGGAIALALDEGCPTGVCEGRRETRGAGLALIGVGAALTATAGVLFWRTTRTSGRESAARGLTVVGGPGRLGLAYGARF